MARKIKWIASFDTQNEAIKWILNRGEKLIPNKDTHNLMFEWDKFERKWDVYLVWTRK